MLTQEELASYRTALESLERDVRQQLTSIDAWCEPVAPDVSLGRLTRSDAMQDQQMALHQRERLQTQLVRVGTAIKRIDAGAYGYCLVCKAPIDKRRLDISPDVTLCVPCLEKRRASR